MRQNTETGDRQAGTHKVRHRYERQRLRIHDRRNRE